MLSQFCKMARGHLIGLCLIVFVQGFSGSSDVDYIQNIQRAPSSRIVAGWEAKQGQFPHYVSLRMVGPTGGVGGCGGSIISNQWVLTAAHCLARRFSWVVRYGLSNLTIPEFITDTTEAYIHPDYDQTSSAVQTDDIGLLKVYRYIPYNDNVKPIRMQSSQRKYIEYSGMTLEVCGFGRTNDWPLGGYHPEILYWIYQRGITLDDCLLWYPGSTVIREQTICTQYYNHTSQNICAGDSGGPLHLIDEDGQPTQIGIVSFAAAIGCNSPNPQGYVRPEHYHEWITETTGIDFDWDAEGQRSKDDEIDPNNNTLW